MHKQWIPGALSPSDVPGFEAVGTCRPAGVQLELSLPSSDPPIIGPVSDQYQISIGIGLDQYRISIGSVLDQYWISIGLDQYQISIRSVLDQYPITVSNQYLISTRSISDAQISVLAGTHEGALN